MKLADILNEDRHDDEDHGRELRKTGFWGKRGAGVVFKAESTGRFLIGYRSGDVEEPFTWGTWGGAVDRNDTPETAAEREAREETHYAGKMRLEHAWTFKHPSGFTYDNFIAHVPEEFEPRLNWENVDYEWVEGGKWPEPLHKGLKALIQSGKLA